MASQNKTIKRGVELYIDGKEIKKDIASIERECRKLTKELKNMEIGTDEYRAKAARLKELNGVLQEHRNTIRATNEENKSFLEKINEWMGKWGALVATATAGIAALGMAIMQYRKDLLEREDTKADVKALTGLDDESIAWLEEQAISLSTKMTESAVRIRQSATEILDAFKLVGSAKPELLSDKEALAEVTEQALVLAQAAGMDLKNAVDAVTLSMNQYGAEAKEANRYANVMAAGSKYGAAAVESVTVAVKKSGVAASTAKVPIEQLVGSIEALAEKGIKDAVAGTGLKTFFLKLEKQSNDVRPSVVGLQTALENLAAKNLSTSQMIKMFGLEAYTVAQALVSSADKVKYYSDVVTNTSTATEQASIKSQTAAAKLEQLKNEFTENGMVLAQQLAPAMSKFMGWTNKFIQMLPKLINWVKDYGTEFVTVGIAIVALTTYTKVLAATSAIWNGLKAAVVAYRTAMVLTADAMAGCSVAATKLTALMAAQNIVTRAFTATAILAKAGVAALTLNFNKASGAMAAFNAVVKVNPWAIAISTIVALGYAFTKLHSSVDNSVKKMKEYKRIQEDAANSTANESRKVESLNKIIHDGSLSYNVRKKAIEDMQAIIPEYHASLTTEGKLINDNTEAISSYVKMLTIQAEAEAAASKLTEAKANKKAWLEDETNADRALKVKQAKAAYNKQNGAFAAPDANERKYNSPEEAAMDMFGLSPAVYRVVEETLEELEGEVNMYQDIIDEVEKKITEVKTMQSVVKKGTPTTDSTTQTETEETKRIKKELVEIETEYDLKVAEIKKKYIAGEIKSEQQYSNMLQAIELSRLNAKLQVSGLEESQRADFLDKLTTLEVSMRNKLDAMVKTNKKASINEQLADLSNSYQDQILLLNNCYELGIIPTEERKNEYLMELYKNYIVERRTLLEKQADEELQAVEDEEKQEIQKLDELKYNRMLKEEEYEEALYQLKLRYIQKRKDIENKSQKAITEIGDNEAKIRNQHAEDEYNKQLEEYQSKVEKIKSIAEELGDFMGDVGQELTEALFAEDKKKAWKDFMKSFLNDALSMVEKYILLKQAQMMADAVASSATVVGIPKAVAKIAIKMALIKTAFGAAKGVINGFATGGYTRSGKWDEPQGIVHSNEFVANRHAVANPQIKPVLDMIDQAQKQGTVQNITGEDITNVTNSNVSDKTINDNVSGLVEQIFNSLSPSLTTSVSNLKYMMYYNGGYVNNKVSRLTSIKDKEKSTSLKTESKMLKVVELIDAANKAGSIRNLSSFDIASVAVGAPSKSTKTNEERNSSYQNIPVEELLSLMNKVDETMRVAQAAYEKPSKAYCYVKGKGGIEEAMNYSELMDKNARR